MKIIKSENMDYLSLCKAVKDLSGEYGMKLESIGKSSMGKEIFSLFLGKGNEKVLFCAAFHGSEHITQNIILMLAEEMAEAYNNGKVTDGINIRRALMGRSIVFIPCVNPDGCDIAINGEKAAGERASFIKKLCLGDCAHYNANARGVDINHNFNAGWARLKQAERANGIVSPAKGRYGGEKAESECETKALVNFCRSNNIRHVTALHTQGEVIYWNYGKRTPERAKKMAEIMSLSSGYAMDFPVALATGGGFKDWFIEEFCRPGFTIEMGKGKNPLDIRSAESIYIKAREMLVLDAIM